MSEIFLIPLSDFLKPPKIEESWSKYVPEVSGANAPIEPEIDHEKLIMEALKGKWAQSS